MKSAVSILLCTVLLFLAFGKSALVLNYQINKKEIAETRCENRDKPEMHCNGQCYLAKQLKKAEQKENPTPDFRNLKELSPFIPAENIFDNTMPAVVIEKTIAAGPMNIPSDKRPQGIFHPPEA